MDDLQVVQSAEQVPMEKGINEPVALAEQTPEQLLAQINKTVSEGTQESHEQEPQVVAPVVVPTEKAPVEQTVEKKEVPVAEPPKTASELNDLMAKKGFQSPEDLAKSYKELERQFHKKRQEEARTLKPVAVPEAVPVPQAEPQPYDKTQFLADLERDPLGTIAQITQIVNAPLHEQAREQELHNRVLELSGSPKTAEFNSPVVQQEIVKIFNERPELQTNVTKNLPDVLDLAVARLYREGKLNADVLESGKKMAEQNMLAKQSAAVERASVGSAPQPVTIAQLPPDKQFEALNQLWKENNERIRRG